MKEQAIISRSRLEELESIEKLVMENKSCTTTNVEEEEVRVCGKRVQISYYNINTYNANDSEKILHKAIANQKIYIDRLKEIIKLNEQSIFSRLFKKEVVSNIGFIPIDEAKTLLFRFWQRTSDACPLECEMAENEEIEFIL
jgi:hypothetical protein